MTEQQTVETSPQIEFTKWLEDLRTDLTKSVAGVALRGARPVAVGITEGATKHVSGSPDALIGFALSNEAAGDATVTVYLHDGRGPDGDVVMRIKLAPGESVRDWFHPGVALTYGLFVEADGPVTGSMFMRGAE